MGRDREHTPVPPVASHPPQTTDELPGSGGSPPPSPPAARLTRKQVTELPKHRGCSSSKKNHMARATAPARRKAPNCFYMHLPKGAGKKKTNNPNHHHSLSCLNLQACNPTHVLPARRRGGGPGTDLLSFVAGSADLYAERSERSRQKLSLGSGFTSALRRSLHHRKSPIPAQLLAIYTGPSNGTL